MLGVQGEESEHEAEAEAGSQARVGTGIPISVTVTGTVDEEDGEGTAIDIGRELDCRSCETTSSGPVLARFLLAAPHFFPTDPIRETRELFPALCGVASGAGSATGLPGPCVSD